MKKKRSTGRSEENINFKNIIYKIINARQIQMLNEPDRQTCKKELIKSEWRESWVHESRWESFHKRRKDLRLRNLRAVIWISTKITCITNLLIVQHLGRRRPYCSSTIVKKDDGASLTPRTKTTYSSSIIKFYSGGKWVWEVKVGL